MAFRKTAAVAAVTTAATTVLGTVSLGAPYGRVLGFIARNWASSAKAAAGIDALEKVKLTDAGGVVVFLDAADRDYKTAAVELLIEYDDVNTGLGILPVTGTGAAYVATEGNSIAPPVVQSPISVEVQNAATATDYFEVYLLVEV